ncbi:MAG: signal transduction histidine kinase [Cyanobacteria bacterium RYN_339]|nr:signal transduction histidine kinase [Cyanobacteria bacterium RYN_339]
METQLAALRTELAESRRECALLDRMIAHVPAGIAFLDTDLVFRKVNATLAKFLGLTVEAMLGRRMFDVLPETREYYGPLMEQLLRTGEPFRAVEAPFSYTVNGVPMETFWDFTYMPIVSRDGRPEGVLVLNHEVSERVASQRQLREQITRLKALDQLKADFLNAASHELRTPLTSIKGYAEFLEDGVGGQLTPTQRDHVYQIQAGTQRLRRIVDDMLDFARLEAGVFQLQPLRTDLGKVIEQEVASLRPLAQEKQVVLELRGLVPSVPLVATVDPLRIGQVLLNLVGNAIKFTPAGGHVAVEAKGDAGSLRVEVRDTGIGIPADCHERVFEKFYQVNPSSTREHGGAGLGLAISKALVEAHGGEIGLHSVPGEGSTFWFALTV